MTNIIELYVRMCPVYFLQKQCYLMVKVIKIDNEDMVSGFQFHRYTYKAIL